MPAPKKPVTAPKTAPKPDPIAESVAIAKRLAGGMKPITQEAKERAAAKRATPKRPPAPARPARSALDSAQPGLRGRNRILKEMGF